MLNVLLTTAMFVGGSVAFILDNTIPGKTCSFCANCPRNQHSKTELTIIKQHIVILYDIITLTGKICQLYKKESNCKATPTVSNYEVFLIDVWRCAPSCGHSGVV